MSDRIIQVENVSKWFGDFQALKDINLEVFLKEKILFAPAKAANAGGVAVSEFEMSQNASMQKWSFEKVDDKLKETMQQLCRRVSYTAKEYGVEGNYVDGANIAGFKRVADAMIAEGI